MIRPLHMVVTDNYITVNKQLVDLWTVVEWTKLNCPHYITNQYHGNHHGNDLIDFFFIDCERGKKEMMWFLLRWS